jgi:hypothetical protein
MCLRYDDQSFSSEEILVLQIRTQYFQHSPKIGAINSESASLFHIRPNEGPVFVFGTENSGLSSLAMALSMLGYRCCSDLKTLPDTELQMLLNGGNNRIFDAYVNIGSLVDEFLTLKERYSQAKFIITKSESEILTDKS